VKCFGGPHHIYEIDSSGSGSIEQTVTEETNMPNTTCTPFSLSLLVANKGNSQQISFGLTKGCTNDAHTFWIITFVLKERDAQGNFFDRVNFQLNVNQQAPGKVNKAANLQNGLSVNQQNFVQGPMTEAALRESKPNPVPAALLASAALDEFSAHIKASDTKGKKKAPALGEFIMASSAAHKSKPTLKQLTIALLDIE